MAAQPTIFAICSDRTRNGKTLLARVLVDFLLMEDRDPFCFDLAHPGGALRAYFPGRTALVDFSQEQGRARLFDTILSRGGRDYVIDVPASQLASFCDRTTERGFTAAAREAGFRTVVLYIVDREEASLRIAVDVEEILLPDLFVPVANRFIGSALPEGVPGPVLRMEKIDADLEAIISNRRFSLRLFLLGDESAVPLSLRASLKAFLDGLVSDLRELEPALSLRHLRRGAR